MKIRKIFIFLTIVLLITCSCVTYKKPEIRTLSPEKKAALGFRQGMWIRAATTASPDIIPRIVKIVESMSITDIFVQVVVGGYAYYESDLLPRSQYLSEISGKKYVPLDSLISLFANTGVRVHAWVNTFLYWSLPTPPESVNHVLYTHPDWFIHDVGRVSMADYSYAQWKNSRLEGLYLDPENPEVADFVQSICAEIATKYPVDGIHLDFIRYPGIFWGLPENDEAALLAGIDANTSRWCSLINYARLDFLQRWQIWHAWRLVRNRQWVIARVVDEVNRRVRASNPDCQLSAAVFANPALFRYALAQDWTEWRSETFTPVIMSYTPDITRFIDYMNFAMLHRPDALLGIGLLWPEMQETAKSQAASVRNARGAGVCYFDFVNIDSQLDLTRWHEQAPEQDRPEVDTASHEPVSPVFSDIPATAMVRGGNSMIPWGTDLRFAAFLLSLSLDPGRDLASIGLDRDRFLNHIAQDVAAFEYLDHQVFPIGNRLIEPPQVRLRYAFIPWSEGDSLAVVDKAATITQLTNDSILYPWANNPLASAAFSAQPCVRETLSAPTGIYVFTVDSIYPGGRIARRDDLLAEMIPVYANWTIKTKAASIIANIVESFGDE